MPRFSRVYHHCFALNSERSESIFYPTSRLIEPLEPRVLLAADTVTIAWDNAIGEASEQLYGLNLWQGMNPSHTENADYQNSVNTLAPGIVRFHAAEQIIAGNTKSWVQDTDLTDAETTYAWDFTRIDRVLGNDYFTNNPTKVVSFSNWPANLDTDNDGDADVIFDVDADGRIDADKLDDYGDWIAEVVTYAKDNNLGITHWEPINEVDNKNPYKVSGAGADIADLFNAAAAAIRTADPSASIVGPAWTQPFNSLGSDPQLNRLNMQQFMDDVDPTLIDVWSHHHYVTGSSTNLQTIINRSANIQSEGNKVRGWLDARGLSGLDLWVDEFNMYASFSGDSAGYMRNPESAVFDALTYKYAAERGNIDAILSWNDGDNTYGKMNSGGTWDVRNSGYLMGLANEYFVGDVVSAISTSGASDGEVDAFAVRNGDQKAVMLINRHRADGANVGELSTIDLDFGGWTPGNLTYDEYIVNDNDGNTRIDNLGLTWTGDPQDVTLEPWEVRVWVFDDPPGLGEDRTALADAYVRGGSANANTNYGDAAILRTKDSSSTAVDRFSYVKFDVAGTAGDAFLELTTTAVQSTQTIKVYATADNWTETGLTYNNRPAQGSLLAELPATVVGETLRFDVTGYVGAEAAGDGTASFLIRQVGGNALIDFSSKEGDDAPTLAFENVPASLLDDAYVRGGSNGNTNYGDATILRTKDSTSGNFDRWSFLKFDLAGTSGDATLDLTTVSVQGTQEVRVYATADTWDESTITWNNRPAAGTLLDAVNATTAGQTLSFDVADYVETQRNGDGIASFMVRHIGGNQLVDFSSKEGAAAPELNFTGSPTLLSDNFDDGNANGWALTGGTWQVTAGELEQEDNVSATRAVWNDPAATSWTDYSIDVSFRSSDNDTLGVLFRYQDADNHYRFITNAENGYRQLQRVQGGVATTLAEQLVGYTLNQNYALQITAVGNSLSVTLDGTSILNATDATFGTGTIGLYSSFNSDSFFDDVLVMS